MEATRRLKRTVRCKAADPPATGPLGHGPRRYRRAKGLGLNELARLAKVEPAQLSRLEGGHQVSAHAATLRKLAAALDVDVEHLMRLERSAVRMPGRPKPPTKSSSQISGGRPVCSELESAIERDPTIPRKRKKWLLECVALARK